MVNYVYVILNPLAEIPALSNGPDHVKNRKWHLSADEVSITNTPINQVKSHGDGRFCCSLSHVSF